MLPPRRKCHPRVANVAPILTAAKPPGYLLHVMSLRAVMKVWKVKEAHPTPSSSQAILENSGPNFVHRGVVKRCRGLSFQLVRVDGRPRDPDRNSGTRPTTGVPRS